ncbi:MAG: CocE/NonD family hydrolase [Thermoflexales bacterium]|nr:CocE/NonD family hydrolase [Thermoflexales bacterium]
MKARQIKRTGYLRYGFGLAILALVACGLVGWVLSARRVQPKSLYLTMHDGTKIAVDVWLPAGLAPGQKLPTVMRATCYWRNYQFGPIGQIFDVLGAIPEDMQEGKFWTQAGYALVTVDGRGSGASFGQWVIPWSDEEIADLGQVVDWIVAQSWSNGRVGAYGTSYDGTMAEKLAALNHPAVKAVAPQYNEIDLQFQLVTPGGVLNRGFMQEWNEFNRRLGANDVCALEEAAGQKCDNLKYMMVGVRPVDGDVDGAQLAAAVASHTQVDVFQIAQAIEYRDDLYGSTGKTLGDISPYGRQAAIEASGVPMYVWVNWLDSAMADGAISRYLTFSNPQQLIIVPWAHGGGYHADPFLPPDTPADPLPREQLQMLVTFFGAYLRDGTAAPKRGITYYTLGEGTWKTTTDWPPAGFSSQRWYFGPDGRLSTDAPAGESDADNYTVDWAATTGDANRWYTSLYKLDVVYPDRAEEDKKLLTYTSAPMETDVEITGHPIVSLYVASTESDGAFHVYLEDVAPDGRVTYITEGILRAVHRKISDVAPPYKVVGPYHSFERADSMPMVPGEVTEIRFSLYPTSVLVRQGHRVRVALAGHDASMFARYPAQGTPRLSVQRNSLYPSHIELPVSAR